MEINLIKTIKQLNPWFSDPKKPILEVDHYIPRLQLAALLSKSWDKLCTVIIGPRQAGKTTLAMHLCGQIIKTKRFRELLYLNCDILEIRSWLKGPQFLSEAMEYFELTKPIVFIDEVQRLENPGLLLKSLIDLKLPIKLIASGSSQLEIKSKVQEFLTGRQLEVIVLPLSWLELKDLNNTEQRLLYGSYPQIVSESDNSSVLLQQLVNNYINKDIVEILKLGKPDVLQKLLQLIAHSSGQLVNYNQLASDCGVSVPTVQNYLAILEKTYVIHSIRPFVGNKRSEITTNPIYYFIDNGFRNQILNNFQPLETRTDKGLLVENYVFQELYKFSTHGFNPFSIHYWRTKGGAEVDFILYKNLTEFIPIEVKYQTMREPRLPKGFRSFIDAYQPKLGIILNKNIFTSLQVDNTQVYFVPFDLFVKFFEIIEGFIK